MDIQIGKKNLSVDGVIYISPNGNDSNNGTNRNAPVLTITKAISLCSDNYAVYFMEGNHNLQQKNYGDFINLGGKNIIFYSNPNNTFITVSPFVNTETGNLDSCYFITNGTLKMYNLKIECGYHSRTSGSNGTAILNIENCCIVGNFSGERYWISYDLAEGSTVNNSIIIHNVYTYGSTDQTVSGQKAVITNSVVSAGTFSLGENCKTTTVKSTDMNECLSKTLEECNDTVGIYSGDYSEWKTAINLKKIFIDKINVSNLPSKFNDAANIRILFTNDKKLYVTDIYGVPHLIKSHAHNNSDVLNKFSVNSKGKLLFDGQSLDVSAGGSSVSFDEYTNLDTYKTNQYVIYNNKLYQCIADVTTPEEFDETKWNLIIGDNTKYITFKKVDSLPSENIDENCIYLIARTENSTDIDNYIEYMYIDNKWEVLGPDVSNNVSVSIGLTEW